MTPKQTKPFTGGCTCGEIRYEVSSKPLFVHCCHCSWCQRETGSAFALNAMIEADRVKLTQGQPQRIAIPTLSGTGQIFSRCPSCDIALWSNYSSAGDSLHFLRVGTLDEPDRMPPDIHIFTASMQKWLTLPAGVPAEAAYYQRSRFWPQESLDRLQQLKASQAN